MSIQNIINKAQQIEIDRRKVVGQTISRSQRIKTSERASAQPWRFKVTPPPVLDWTSSRSFIEVIDFNDRSTEYTISLNSATGMQYITAYQGALNNTALGNLAVTGTTTSTLIVGTLPAIDGTVTSSTVVFYAGDFVQPQNSRYPYSVTQTVVRGTGTTISVPLNRPIITSENITLTGNKVLVGNSVTWRVIVGALPTYSLIPSRRVQYNGDFDLIEKII